jgi:serine/threonine-protein kinase
MIGSRLGSWILDRELGRGGMGEVFLAHRDPVPADGPEQVAIKVLAAELAVDPGFQARFQREIDILRQLDHPNIVRFRDSGQQKGRPYFVMEYVPGPSYDTLLNQQGRLPWPDVLDLAWQIAPALKHAHDRGIIHRDLKPSNLLRAIPPPSPTFVYKEGDTQRLTPAQGGAGLVKLTDFGIASLFASPHLTVTGGIVGTAEYLSPEQASGKPVTKRSDLYSLGVVLYTLVTGRTPFYGDPAELLQKHRFAQFDRPARLVPEMPHELDEILCDLLEKDPANRPGDAMVLFRRLDSLKRKLAYQATQAGTETSHPMLRSMPQAATRSDGLTEGPATLMSRLMRQELERQKHGGPIRQFFNRPSVLFLLLAITLGLIAYAFWPLSAERMYQRGVALMESDNFEDQETAWDKYLGPLLEKDPTTPHRAEVEKLRAKYEDAKAERHATNRAAWFAGPMSEAQWFYEEGLRFHQRGAEAEACRIWTALVNGFQDVPAEKPWVSLAREALARPKNQSTTERQWGPVRRAVSRARTMREQGRDHEAAEILNALKELYRGDKQAEAILKGD